MIVCIILCLTLVFCLVYTLRWARKMAQDGLPMFTRGELVWKPNEEPAPQPNPVGFSDSEEEATEKLTDAQKREKLLQEPTTLVSSLLRGEVDLDEIFRE